MAELVERQNRYRLLYLIHNSKKAWSLKELQEVVYLSKKDGANFTYDDFAEYPGWHHSERLLEDLSGLLLIGFISTNQEGIEKGDYGYQYVKSKIDDLPVEEKNILDRNVKEILLKSRREMEITLKKDKPLQKI